MSDLEWINDYVGVPYAENGRDRDGWDCWGLVLAVYRERLGLELPDWRWSAPFRPIDKLRAFSEVLEGDPWAARTVEIEAPEAWALAMVYGERRPHHVGVVAGGGVLHAGRYGGTVCQPVHRFLTLHPRVRWFRWRR